MFISSGDNHMVINLGNTRWMFYEFDGEKVTSMKYYDAFETKEDAKEVFLNYGQQGETSAMEREKIEEVKQEGRFIVIIPKASSYATTTKQEVIETYTLLQELYNAM